MDVVEFMEKAKMYLKSKSSDTLCFGNIKRTLDIVADFVI